MEPRRITPLRKTPINRMFFAINHFVSTGDHFGEGVAMPEPGRRTRFIVLVNTAMAEDQADFETFRARFDQVGPRFQTALEDGGREGIFHLWSFVVSDSLIDEMAAELRSAASPLGWGSGKSIIDQHQWHE